MADSPMGEKSEAPTPRRRQEAREEGDVARSADLTSGLILFGSVLLMWAFGLRMLGALKAMMHTMLAGAWADNTAKPGDVGTVVAVAGDYAAQALLPIALGVVVLALIGGLLQVGIMVTFKPLTPKLSKISPISGAKQLFSLRSLVRFGMSLAKVIVVAAVAAWCVHEDLPALVGLVSLDVQPLLAAAGSLVFWLAIKIAAVLLLLGLLDFAYQKWQKEQEMKMTKQEVKEEFKRMEGDPLVKQRRARVARQLAMQRLAQDVPKADVIVTNPTHYAVALQYDGDSMAAPKVIAKGADYMALRIRQLAAAHGVPVVERPPLARALWRNVEVGQQIPADHYAAVAEILAYVYRMQGRRSA